MKKLSFLQNTIVLVIANLITGAFGFLFSVILSKEIGAHGIGLYQMVMPIYSFFICFACGGTTTSISKIIAEHNSKNNTRELYKTVSISIAFFSFWTILISILVVFLAPSLSTILLKDPRTYLPILVFVPALLLVSIGSILKGYFYGLQNSTFPAVIDIGEKAVRIIVLITLVTYLRPMGLKFQVAGAISAMVAGELTSTLLLYLFYKKSNMKKKHLTGKPDNVFQIITNVLSISLPLSANGLLGTSIYSFIAAMVPRRLQAAGFSPETSIALFGKISGMGMHIIMFPSIIIGAISIILVPVISEASSGKTMNSVNRKIYKTLKITTAIAMVSAGIFLSIPTELGQLFYSRNDLGNIIFSLSFGVIFTYVEATLFGILNGLGKQGILLRNTIIMSVIDVTLLYSLLGIPEINIYGYAINFVICPLVGCLLNSYEIKKITDVQIDLGELFVFPIIVGVAVAFALKNLKPVMNMIIANPTLSTIALIIAGITVYSILYSVLNPFFKSKKL